MGVMDLKICMQGHRGEARDDSYTVVPLHVLTDDQKQW